MVFGDAFADRSLLDGEFDEFFFRPLHDSSLHRDAAAKLLRSIQKRHRDRARRHPLTARRTGAVGVG
jgi:hypothetical protein